jgi:hypothetical protein
VDDVDSVAVAQQLCRSSGERVEKIADIAPQHEIREVV